MTILFAVASDQLPNESDAFADVPGMTLTTDAGGDWLAVFSCTLLIPKEGRVEFKLVADGSDVSNGLRALDVSAYGLKNDRVFTLEAKTAPGSGKVVKVQWRMSLGKALISDRRLSLFQ